MLYLFIKLDHCKVTTTGLSPSQMTAFSVVVVQSQSHVWLFATPWTAALQAPLSFTISLSLLKFMSIELVMVSNNLIFCYPLLLLPSIFLSFPAFPYLYFNESALHIRHFHIVFQWVSSSHQAAKILELIFSIYQGLIYKQSLEPCGLFSVLYSQTLLTHVKITLKPHKRNQSHLMKCFAPIFGQKILHTSLCYSFCPVC